MILFLFLFLFIFAFSSFYFFNQKYGATPLYIAAENGHEQIVEILLEKGKPNVDLADKVILLILFLFFFSFSFFYFFNVKYGATPLYVAAENGYEKIVQILLEKGKPNVDLARKVLFFFDLLSWSGFRSPFSFSFLIFPFFFINQRVEKLLFILLLVKDMNKLFNFCWKKENQMLISQLRFFFIFF